MIKLFKETTIENAFNIVNNNVKKIIDNMDDSRLRNSNIEELAQNLRESYSIKPLGIDMGSRAAKVTMVNIRGSEYPPNYHVEQDKYYPCAKITYTFDIKGNTELFSVQPKGRTFLDVEGNISNDKLEINYQTLYGNIDLSDDVKTTVKAFITPINEELPIMIGTINAEVSNFNDSLESIIYGYLKERIQHIDKLDNQNNDLNSL